MFWWDNASTDNTTKYIESLNLNLYKKVNLKNDGIVIPRIKLYEEIKKENFDYLLEIHADMVFPHKWIDEVFSIEDNRSIIIMPTIINTNKIISKQQINDLSEKYKENRIIECSRQVHPWLVKLNMLNLVGGYYDKRYHPMRLEDADLVWRVMKNGYKIKATRNSVVCHYGGKTRNKAKIKGVSNKVFEKKFKISNEEFKAKFHEHPIIVL
jgi:hypothetical protein